MKQILAVDTAAAGAPSLFKGGRCQLYLLFPAISAELSWKSRMGRAMKRAMPLPEREM